MNIGIIGSGGMGKILATKFYQLGHTVSITNSSGGSSLKKIADEIGAIASTTEQVVKNSDVIIISIPQKSISLLNKTLFNELKKNAVVIETGNYYPTLRDGAINELDEHGIDSLWVQDQLGIPVIKAFNSILAESIRDFGAKKGDKNRIAMPVSGDSSTSKQIVFGLIEELGFDPFDIGGILQSWKQQPGSPIYCRDINLHTIQRRVQNMGTDWLTMREMIIGKRRTDEGLMKADYAEYLKILQELR